MRYKKIQQPIRSAQSPALFEAPVIGMLFLVDVKLWDKTTHETTKHKVLIVGGEAADIERKMIWMFDTGQNSIEIKSVEKVREKVHFISTVITQENDQAGPVIKREDGSQTIQQPVTFVEPYDPKLYAVGITTTMLAKDRDHALRKVAHAIISSVTPGKSHTGASLHEDSTIMIEEVPKSSGYTKPRDVSNEVNKAHIMRG